MNYFIGGSRLPDIVAAQPATLTLQESAQDLLKKLRVKVSGKLTPQVPHTGILVLSNHLSALDLFIIGAQTPRPFFFVGSQLLRGLGGTWLNHIMPIYLSASRAKHWWDWPRKVVWHYRERVTSSDKAHAHNLTMMEHASHLLMTGQTVLLFPTGRSLRGRWANGVGYLLKSLAGSRVKVVFAHIRPMPWWVHVVEFMPGWVVRWLPWVQTRVTWAPLLDINLKELRGLEPREVTTWLKDKHDKHCRDALDYLEPVGS